MDHIISSRAARGSRGFRLLRRLLTLMALGRSRRRLGQLDAHLLRDIGLTPEEARREAETSVWHAPDHWLR